MSTYAQGAEVRIVGEFKSAAGVLTDPAKVYAYYRSPSGVTVDLEYGVDAGLVKDSTGIYHVDVDASEQGEWFYSFRSTGVGKTAGEKHFRVKDSTFF